MSARPTDRGTVAARWARSGAARWVRWTAARARRAAAARARGAAPGYDDPRWWLALAAAARARDGC